MAQWNEERLEMLREGVRLCFSRWTALQLAVDNEWGGRDSFKKSQQLNENVVHFLTQTKGTLYIDDLEALLEDSMTDMFNTDLEDGSQYEVAETVMYLNEECGAGNFDRVKSMASSSAKANSKISICDDPEVGSSIVPDKVDDPPPQIHPEAMDIDKSTEAAAEEDEWTVVQHRRKKGGKRTA